jgi:hypothetical protein
MIVTGVRRDAVPPAFEPVLTAVTQEVAAVAGDISLYLYGSVASGTAPVGQSDVDFLTLGMPATRAHAVGNAASTRFADLCRGVALAPAQLEDLAKGDDEAYGLAVFLRHYCVHLVGPDPGKEFGSFPADARAARGFNGDIDRHLRDWRARSREPRYEASHLGRRVARKTLLAVTGLVSVYDATWTTDRIAAAERWSEIDPTSASPLTSLVAWSDGEVHPTRAEVEAALTSDGIVERVTVAFADLIGLWDRSAD